MKTRDEVHMAVAGWIYAYSDRVYVDPEHNDVMQAFVAPTRQAHQNHIHYVCEVDLDGHASLRVYEYDNKRQRHDPHSHDV